MKTCSKCNIEKQFEQFYKDKTSKNGFTSRCIECISKLRIENKEKRKEIDRRHYLKNKENIRKRNNKWNEENKEKMMEWKRKYKNKRRNEDEGFRIQCKLRSRIYNALKGTVKSQKTMDLIGCSVEFLIDYLEGTKVDGKDYSDAHIDHIRPCASFDLTEPEQQRECFHYTNLQYLPAKENMLKGARW